MNITIILSAIISLNLVINLVDSQVVETGAQVLSLIPFGSIVTTSGIVALKLSLASKLLRKLGYFGAVNNTSRNINHANNTLNSGQMDFDKTENEMKPSVSDTPLSDIPLIGVRESLRHEINKANNYDPSYPAILRPHYVQYYEHAFNGSEPFIPSKELFGAPNITLYYQSDALRHVLNQYESNGTLTYAIGDLPVDSIDVSTIGNKTID